MLLSLAACGGSKDTTYTDTSTNSAAEHNGITSTESVSSTMNNTEENNSLPTTNSAKCSHNKIFYNGKTEYHEKCCSQCKAVLLKEPHTLTLDEKSYVAGTCEKPGYAFYECLVCKSYTHCDELTASHESNSWKLAEEASCLSPAKYTGKCKFCGIPLEKYEGEVKPHSYLPNGTCSVCGNNDKADCTGHHMDVPTCQIPSTCIYCGYTEGSPVQCQYINGVCHFCGKRENNAAQSNKPTTSKPTTITSKPTTTSKPTETSKPTTTTSSKPTTSTPTYTDVKIISSTETISNTTINTDVYITSTGIATFNNVTVNGNVYCYGQLTVSGGTANNIYAYYWQMGGLGSSSCPSYDGTHGKFSGFFRNAGDIVIQDYALDYAFNKWGKK